MSKSKPPPKRPGWYWVWRRDYPGDPEITLCIRDSDGNLVANRCGDGFMYDWADLHIIDWRGPLRPPARKKKKR